MQRLEKHIPAATNIQATIEELLLVCNGEVGGLYNNGGTVVITMQTVFSAGPPRG
jgi:hypothetical protein